jgi:bifunctional DNA-binding transcriptional regulator/antitoxin component of YhaV-PrlF toxin-antitoxin module
MSVRCRGGLSRRLSNFPREVVLCCTQNMTITVKNNAVGLVVPPSVRRRAGIKAGDRLEFKVSGGIINIIPKLPSADDEYTPAQRRAIDAQLKDAAKGPYYGPFETADAAIKFLRTEVRTRKTGKSKTAKR